MLNLTRTILNAGLVPHISFANFPRCMKPAGSSQSTVNPPQTTYGNYTNFAHYAANVTKYFFDGCSNGSISNCGTFSDW